MPDGDLWELAEKLLTQRGKGKTRVAWTKGHAGWNWILERSDNAASVDNSLADYAADLGPKAVGNDAADIELVVVLHMWSQHEAMYEHICHLGC